MFVHLKILWARPYALAVGQSISWNGISLAIMARLFQLLPADAHISSVFHADGYLYGWKPREKTNGSAIKQLCIHAFTSEMMGVMRAREDRRVIERGSRGSGQICASIYGADDANLYLNLHTEPTASQASTEKKCPALARNIQLFDCPLKWQSLLPARTPVITAPVGTDDVESTIYETSLFPDNGNLRVTLENNWIDTDEY